MGGGFPIDLILFAAIALFLIFRLGSTLGKRTGHQRKPTDLFGDKGAPGGPGSKDRSGEREDQASENVIRMPGARQDEDAAAESPQMAGPAASGLTQIRVADPDFDPEGFLDGAKAAFEMIVKAYAEGDGKTLKQLLSKDVYDSFAAAIREREKAGHSMQDILYGIDSAEIVDAGMEGSTARVTVEFVSQQVNVTYDDDGNVVAGDPNGVITVTDIWTFARDTKSRDPNWELAETRVPDSEETDGGSDGGDGSEASGGNGKDG